MDNSSEILYRISKLDSKLEKLISLVEKRVSYKLIRNGLVDKEIMNLLRFQKMITPKQKVFYTGDISLHDSENQKGIMDALTPHVNNISVQEFPSKSLKIYSFDCEHAWQVFKAAYLMGWQTNHSLVNQGTGQEIKDASEIYSILKKEWEHVKNT